MHQKVFSYEVSGEYRNQNIKGGFGEVGGGGVPWIIEGFLVTKLVEGRG